MRPQFRRISVEDGANRSAPRRPSAGVTTQVVAAGRPVEAGRWTSSSRPASLHLQKEISAAIERRRLEGLSQVEGTSTREPASSDFEQTQCGYRFAACIRQDRFRPTPADRTERTKMTATNQTLTASPTEPFSGDATYITQSSVLERDGWTRAAIQKFLGDADKTKKNPRYACAAPMKLFDLARVESVENTDEFVAWRVKSAKRSATGRDVASARAEVVFDSVEEYPVRVRVWKRERVIRAAIESYNAWHPDAEYPATRQSDEDFLTRISHNFVRHNLTNYEEGLEHLQEAHAGQPGARGIYDQFSDRILERVHNLYPWLPRHRSRPAGWEWFEGAHF